jgi:lipoprotein signal peptidase
MNTRAASHRRRRRPADPHALALFCLIMLTAFLLDWATKTWALHNVSQSALALGSMTLSVARNDGFAFSAGSGVISPWLIVLARLGVLAGLGLFAFRVAEFTRLRAVGLALLFAGGLGNAADIIFRNGAVVDFIGTGRGFVFNIADVLILAGLLASAPLIRLMGRYVRQQLASGMEWIERGAGSSA